VRLHLLPFFGKRQLRAISTSSVRRWQNELQGKLAYETVMGCRSLLYRILQAAEDDRAIPANPVRKVPAPKPPVDPDALLGRAKRRCYTPEEFGRLLAGATPAFRDHLLCLAGTGLRVGELLGLRAHRVNLTGRYLEVLEVRYEAGKIYGRGYKDRPKSRTSIRVVPLAHQVAEAIARQLPPDHTATTLVFAGPGGGNHVPAGTRTELGRDNLRRAYRAAVRRVTDPAARLAFTPGRVLRVLRAGGPAQTVEAIRAGITGRTPTMATMQAALGVLEQAGLARRCPEVGEVSWTAATPPDTGVFADLDVHGPHDLRHTFSTWLEDAGIPARVIDEVMGHSGGRRGGGAPELRGSAIGGRYRWTTRDMAARVVAAIEERLAVALAVAGQTANGAPRIPTGSLLAEAGSGNVQG
jgi:integrase